MNYTELNALIISYTENDETTFVATIPDFVRQTEVRILNELRLPMFRKNSTGTVAAGSQYLATPADYLAPFSLAIINGTDHEFLELKDSNFIRTAFPTAASTGTPRYYAVWDDDAFILGPTPDATYTAEFHYFYKPDSIVVNNTSWLGDNADHLLLYGSLVEAYIFMKGEPDMIERYQSRYDRALDRMVDYASARTRRDVYRGGELQLPPRP